jgi:glycosyl-4,4'-diaponeurosporenoate acyltransferase
MPLIRLPALWLIAVNTFAWIIIHFGVAYFTTRIRDDRFNPRSMLFKTRAWELKGKIYQNIFRVKRWKSLLPSGGKIFGLFSINSFHSSTRDYINKWVTESCRAELTHWLAMLPALLFFLWNPFEAWSINIIYALCANTPCIISQRYNRPRVLALAEKRDKSKKYNGSQYSNS